MGVAVVDALKEAACVHTRWEDVKKARASAANVSAGSGIGSADEANERSELIVTAVNLIASIPARRGRRRGPRAVVEYGAHVLVCRGAQRFESTSTGTTRRVMNAADDHFADTADPPTRILMGPSRLPTADRVQF